ncbi:hypothetical protein HMN09_00482100 [Mycena chlorophos]|uniref:C2H2-type domain-containing protein n=1 Tax=Mycena chlorophos TaxID=658473 RepID=A0A8H6THL2_MYCCL|nr:hypothetical protein HMN09_00482100 [Mycena chlorophos]
MASLRAASPPRDSDSDSESSAAAAGSTLACALGCTQPWVLCTGPTLTTQRASRVQSGSDGDDDSDSELDEDTDIEIEAAGDSEGPRKHVCATCTKAFHRPSSLRTHMHTHTGALPFVCPFPRCEQGFNVKSNLRRHYRTHKGMKNAELPAVLPTTGSGRRAVRGRRRKGAGAGAEERELGACSSAKATTSLDIPATTLGRASPTAVDAIRNPRLAFSHPGTSRSPSPSPPQAVASIPAPEPPRFPPLPQFDHDFSGFAGMARTGKSGAEGYGIATGLGFRTAAMLMTNLKPGPTLVEGQFPRPVG